MGWPGDFFLFILWSWHNIATSHHIFEMVVKSHPAYNLLTFTTPQKTYNCSPYRTPHEGLPSPLDSGSTKKSREFNGNLLCFLFAGSKKSRITPTVHWSLKKMPRLGPRLANAILCFHTIPIELHLGACQWRKSALQPGGWMQHRKPTGTGPKANYVLPPGNKDAQIWTKMAMLHGLTFSFSPDRETTNHGPDISSLFVLLPRKPPPR